MAIEYRTELEYIEFLDGVAHPKVSPRSRHGVVQGAFSVILREAGRERGWVATEWDCRVPDRERLTKFIPDASFVAFERLRPLSEHDREFPPFAPDVAVEVMSPGDDRAYLEKKIELYIAYGSRVVFDVDPVERTVRAISAAGERTLRSGDRFADVSVAWLTFEVAELFADLDML